MRENILNSLTSDRMTLPNKLAYANVYMDLENNVGRVSY